MQGAITIEKQTTISCRVLHRNVQWHCKLVWFLNMLTLLLIKKIIREIRKIMRRLTFWEHTHPNNNLSQKCFLNVSWFYLDSLNIVMLQIVLVMLSNKPSIQKFFLPCECLWSTCAVFHENIVHLFKVLRTLARNVPNNFLSSAFHWGKSWIPHESYENIMQFWERLFILRRQIILRWVTYESG